MLTRFAPSPTGALHIGHAWSAFFAQAIARTHGGRMILRIEDIDCSRCRPEFIDDIYTDLEWLGLKWTKPVLRQSTRMIDYAAIIERLQAMELLYPCFCTRKDIKAEIDDAGAAPHGPDGPLYPGTCRALTKSEQQEKIASGAPYALRLDVEKACDMVGQRLTWRDQYQGEQTATPEILGDVVLARKGFSASYHLCVVADDAFQNITHISRGDDLFHASHMHRLLQAVLHLPVPLWSHHPLLLDENGQRFAKRNKSVTIQSLREAGKSQDDVLQMIWSALPAKGPWRRLLMDL
jgi:glutamyl-Q tRNA(Asp) synthetase